MARRFLRRLVVDACVLRAATGSRHSDSVSCVGALEEIEQVGHSVVETPAIYAEWRDHAIGFSVRWLAKMQSRGRIVSLDDEPDVELRTRIEDSGQHPRRIEAALKDIHLLEAAKQTDRAIISVERRSRQIFMQIPKALDGIAWVDPIQHTDATCRWLRAGARAKAWPH